MVAGKIEPFVFHPKSHFQPNFDPKHPRDLIKPIHDHQKNSPITQNPPKIKIHPELKSIVLGVFEVKKNS